ERQPRGAPVRRALQGALGGRDPRRVRRAGLRRAGGARGRDQARRLDAGAEAARRHRPDPRLQRRDRRDHNRLEPRRIEARHHNRHQGWKAQLPGDRRALMSEFLQQLINGLSLGAIYALIALGYTMVYGVLRFINFAHSDVFMVGAFIGYFAGRHLPQATVWGGLAAMAAAMAGCAVLGIAIERLVYRPLRGGPTPNGPITATRTS